MSLGLLLKAANSAASARKSTETRFSVSAHVRKRFSVGVSFSLGVFAPPDKCHMIGRPIVQRLSGLYSHAPESAHD